jgi:hypothetical protein
MEDNSVNPASRNKVTMIGRVVHNVCKGLPVAQLSRTAPGINKDNRIGKISFWVSFYKILHSC